jgi:hypothetical protein
MILARELNVINFRIQSVGYFRHEEAELMSRIRDRLTKKDLTPEQAKNDAKIQDLCIQYAKLMIEANAFCKNYPFAENEIITNCNKISHITDVPTTNNIANEIITLAKEECSIKETIEKRLLDFTALRETWENMRSNIIDLLTQYKDNILKNQKLCSTLPKDCREELTTDLAPISDIFTDLTKFAKNHYAKKDFRVFKQDLTAIYKKLSDDFDDQLDE